MKDISRIAADWWDFTTIDKGILRDAAELTLKDIAEIEWPVFKVLFY